MLQDLRFALRMLVRNPATGVAAVLTLALGIGATTAIFSLGEAVLFRELPFEEPARLAYLWETGTKMDSISVNLENFEDWHAGSETFEHLALYRGSTLNLTGEGVPERLVSLQATAEIFETLGVEPLLGRPFTAEEDARGERVVLLGHGLWQRRFGGDPAVVGRSLSLSGEPFTVLAVLPAALDGERLRWYDTGDLWVPLGLYRADIPPGRNIGPGLTAVGRLAPGASIETARLEMDGIAASLAAAYPETNTGKGVAVVPIREEEVGSIRPALVVAGGAIGLVLLIGCANVANLQLARAASRRREVTLRTALGAGRGRLVRQLLTESTVLAGVGGAFGVLAAFWGVKLMAAALPDGVALPASMGLDGRALLFALSVSLATGLLFGLVPALQVSRADLRGALVESTAKTTGSRRSRRLAHLLVVGEVALAMMLLVGASLLVRSFLSLRGVDPGFRPEGVLTLRLDPPEATYREPARWQAFYRQLLERLEALPEVEAAGVTTLLPLEGNSSETLLLAEGEPLPAGPQDIRLTLVQTVSPGYFDALGIELLQGRLFTERDRADSPAVTVVDETLASTLWPGENPLGKRVAFDFERMDLSDPGPIYREVVGVVRHVRHYRLEEESRVEAYATYNQPLKLMANGPGMAVVVRSGSGDSLALAAPVRREVLALDPELPVASVESLDAIVARQWSRSEMISRLLGAFSTAALALAALGLYGVVATSVARRTREVGIRMALGAPRAKVLGMVLGQGLALAGAGAALGLGASFLAGRLLSGLLYGVSPHDPVAFFALPLFLMAVAAAASFPPARRATRVDPRVALRDG